MPRDSRLLPTSLAMDLKSFYRSGGVVNDPQIVWVDVGDLASMHTYGSFLQQVTTSLESITRRDMLSEK